MASVSVIVPVFGARDSVSSCLESLCDQTLDDIEIVLVDDHGADDSIELAHTFVKAYSGPKSFVFTQTPANGGPGAARNVGLEAAGGKYVAFVDSDDFVEPDFCEALFNAAESAGADIAYCHLLFDYAGGKSVESRNPVVNGFDFEGRQKRKFLFHYKSYFTTYIYKSEFLKENGIKFPVTRSAEDSCFLGCCLLSAQKIACVDKPMYHYMVYNTSVSKKRDKGRYKSRLESFRCLRQYAREKGLYEKYLLPIRVMSLKKGYLLAARDYIKNNL